MHSSSTRQGRGNGRARAFTLVELLVVIGIIAILIAVLLPALHRAREQARSAQCMSNIHQLAIATINWTTDHNGQMPGGAGFSPSYYDQTTRTVKRITITNDADPIFRNVADWIAWLRVYDPVTPYPLQSVPSQNITDSALTSYLGFKRRDHKTDQEAPRMNPVLDSIYRCPSDNLEGRPSHADVSHGYYRYSYGMNSFFANPVDASNSARFEGRFSGKINSVRKSSERIMFVCMDEKTIDDGLYSPNASKWTTGRCDLVSSRHESRIKGATSLLNPGEKKQEARGNVGFFDGHVEFFSRKDALRQRYTGSPTKDPDGF